MAQITKTSQVKSLKEICIGCLGKWIHCIEDVGDMEKGIWTEILHAAHTAERATPNRISLIESNCPHLECDEVDIMFWRTQVIKKFGSRRLPTHIIEPYPVTRDRVSVALQFLLEWQKKQSGAEARALPQVQLVDIEKALVTVKLLSDTQAGHILKSLLKTLKISDDSTTRVKNILKKWKDYHKLWSATNPTTTSGLILPHGLSPTDLEKAMEDLNTWKSLYFFLEDQKSLLLKK